MSNLPDIEDDLPQLQGVLAESDPVAQALITAYGTSCYFQGLNSGLDAVLRLIKLYLEEHALYASGLDVAQAILEAVVELQEQT